MVAAMGSKVSYMMIRSKHIVRKCAVEAMKYLIITVQVLM